MKLNRGVGFFSAIFVFAGLIFIFFSSIQTPASHERVWPSSEWLTSSPESQGMSSAKLDAMTRWVEDNGVKIDSVLVTRHGYIVYEMYFNPSYGVNSTHLLHSVSKSVTSAIVGVAVDRGLIHLDDKVLDYFPEMTIQNRGQWKEEITIKDLLTMTAGLQWDEWSTSYDSPLNDLYKMRTSINPYQYLLDKPMEAMPGEKWVYNTGISDLLTEIVKRATGSNFLDYGVQNIFSPLKISRCFWETDYYGRYLGGSTLSLTTRDMAKFGYLFLNNGTWDGKTILSPGWVSESLRPVACPNISSGYGYQWWSYPELGVYYASGRHEQGIYISPELDLVVAITGSVSDDSASVYSPNNMLLNRYILPACRDFSPKTLTYSKNNITLTYPAGTVIREVENGSIHEVLTFISNECKIIVFGNLPNFENELRQEEILFLFKELKLNENQSDYFFGNLASIDSSDRKVMVQSFNATISGTRVEAINGYWYCDETHRHFILMYVKIDEILGEKQMINGFKSFLANIICH